MQCFSLKVQRCTVDSLAVSLPQIHKAASGCHVHFKVQTATCACALTSNNSNTNDVVRDQRFEKLPNLDNSSAVSSDAARAFELFTMYTETPHPVNDCCSVLAELHARNKL